MSTLSSILFWSGIVFMVDGALGLLYKEQWTKLVEGVDIQRIAMIEIAVAVGMLFVHYILLLNLN